MAAAPGWYDDPTQPGRSRWWDGQRWHETAPRLPAPPLAGAGSHRSLAAAGRSPTPRTAGRPGSTLVRVVVSSLVVALLLAAILWWGAGAGAEPDGADPAPEDQLFALDGLPGVPPS